MAEGVEPLRCTAGWEVEAETALKGPEPLSFPIIVALDHGAYAKFDGGWQRYDWKGTPRGPLLQLPPGDGEVASSGDRLLITRRSDAGVAVHALEPDGGFTRYATIPVTDAVGSSPYETSAGVLVFSELPDGGVRLDRTTATSSVAVPYPAGRWPAALAEAGSRLLLLTGYPHELSVTPLTPRGETSGATVVHGAVTTSGSLQPCANGTAALITEEHLDDGGFRGELRWLADDGKRVKGPVALPTPAVLPNLLCAGDLALAAWTLAGAKADLRFARVTSDGAVTPEPIALSEEPGVANWYARLSRSDERLGLTWLRYSDDGGYRSMLASLRCKTTP